MVETSFPHSLCISSRPFVFFLSLQQQRHGASLQHEVQEQSASVRPAAGDAGRAPPPPPGQTR